MSLPRIAITMGDPAGVGPELCLRLLADERVRQFCDPVVFGDAGVLRRVARHLGWPEPERPDDLVGVRTHHDPCVVDRRDRRSAIEPGKVSAACGRAAYEYFTLAIDEALAGRVDAIATGPLNKEALHAAGIPVPRAHRDPRRAARTPSGRA